MFFYLCLFIYALFSRGKGNAKEKKAAFRQSFFRLGEVRSLLPAGCPVLALTATATAEVRKDTIEGLGLKPDTHQITVSPDRANIYLYKTKVNKTLDCFQWLVDILRDERNTTPRTIVYCKSQKHCGKLYQFFKYELGKKAFFPEGAKQVCQNSLIAMYHANTLPKHKETVAESLFNTDGICRVVFATTALGMGVNLKDVRNVIHYGPPREVDDFVQEMGRAGRDGNPAKSLLFYAGIHLKKCSPSMKEYATNTVGKCLREILLKDFGEDVKRSELQAGHDCCIICHEQCNCFDGKCNIEVPVFANIPSTQKPITKRKVTKQQKDELRELLTDHKKQLELNCPAYVLSSEATTGFTDSLIKSVIKNAKSIFNLDDLIELTPVFKKSQAVKILYMIRDVFEDFELNMESEIAEDDDNINMDIDYAFGGYYESDSESDSDGSVASDMTELSGIMELHV